MFKIGDRVRVIAKHPDSRVKIGETGTVKRLQPEYSIGEIGVELDRYINGRGNWLNAKANELVLGD